MQKKAAPLVAADLDLPAGDELVATGADAAVIQRRPFPARVGGAQNVEAIFGCKRLLHGDKKTRVAKVPQSVARMKHASMKS